MAKYKDRLVEDDLLAKEPKPKRKVVCIYGKFNNESDFVLEPVCSEKCKCDICKNAFYIEKC